MEKVVSLDEFRKKKAKLPYRAVLMKDGIGEWRFVHLQRPSTLQELVEIARDGSDDEVFGTYEAWTFQALRKIIDDERKRLFEKQQ